MFPGQPAALSNQLLVGDIVLEVNGNSLENASHQDAINMIRHEPSIVRLLVKRSPSSIPAVLLSRASSDASDIDPVQLLNDIQNKLRTDAVKSPPQGFQTNSESGPTLKSVNSFSDELPNTENFADRTEVWVKQESSSIRPRDFENDKPLTHQLSDPLARLPRQVHEPITTSNSLPGKFALKSRYFDKVPEEKTIEKKDSVSSVNSDLEKRDSGKIVSESDLPALIKNLKSQDSLHRTMSPRAPLAEYEESDIDEGIMISVDDGTIMNISDGTDHEDDIDKTLSKTDVELSYDKDDFYNDNNDINLSSTEKHTITNYDNTEDVLLTVADRADHILKKSKEHNDLNNDNESVPSVNVGLNDNDDDDSIDDNNDEDIDSVLELLDAAHRDSKTEAANLVEKQPDDKIILDIQEPEQATLAHAAIIEKNNVYSTEREPELKGTETSFSDIHEDLPGTESFSVANGEVSDSDEESHHSDVNQDNETIDNDSSLTVEEDKDEAITPKEEVRNDIKS